MTTLKAARVSSKGRPYYPPRRIELICNEALREVGLMPDTPMPVRIERFVEKKFGLCVEYIDLPAGILGYTTFTSEGPTKMVVAKALVENSTQVSQRRTNTTLAHESGHCLLHAHLFTITNEPSSLFPEGDAGDPRLGKILCRDHTVGCDGKWWEFQANACIGSLLLPQHLVEQAIRQFLQPQGLLGIEVLPENLWGKAESALSEIFDVNPIAARFRLQQLLPLPGQQTL